jgi:hypothetical protein
MLEILLKIQGNTDESVCHVMGKLFMTIPVALHPRPRFVIILLSNSHNLFSFCVMHHPSHRADISVTYLFYHQEAPVAPLLSITSCHIHPAPIWPHRHQTASTMVTHLTYLFMRWRPSHTTQSHFLTSPLAQEQQKHSWMKQTILPLYICWYVCCEHSLMAFPFFLVYFPHNELFIKRHICTLRSIAYFINVFYARCPVDAYCLPKCFYKMHLLTFAKVLWPDIHMSFLSMWYFLIFKLKMFIYRKDR